MEPKVKHQPKASGYALTPCHGTSNNREVKQVEPKCGCLRGGIEFVDSYLRRTAIHEEFNAVDKAAVIGREEQDGLGDFIGCAGAT